MLQYAVEVLDLVKQTLPVISAASRSLGRNREEEGGVYSDTKHLHYATVETEHPYKPSSVTHYQVREGREGGKGGRREWGREERGEGGREGGRERIKVCTRSVDPQKSRRNFMITGSIFNFQHHIRI